MADKNIGGIYVKIGADTSGLDMGAERAKRALGEVDQSARGASSGLGIMTRAAGALGAVLASGAIVRMADQWSEINARVNNAAGSMENGRAVMARLEQMARRTYSSLGQTAESWLQNSTALRELGYSTQQQLDLTEALNNALVISATRGQRAQTVMEAWSRAMALGELRGQNLNTIIQNGGRLTQALAESMGVSTTELRRLGEQGKITTDVMFGVTAQLEQLREEADAMPATLGDAAVIMGDAILGLVGRVDQALGASEGLAVAIVDLADNIRDATGTIVGVFTMFADEAERVAYWGGALAIAFGGPYVASFVAARVATFSLVGALTALRGIMIRTGIGAVVVAVGELAYQFMRTREEVENVGEALDDTAQEGVTFGQRLELMGRGLDRVLRGVAYGIESAFRSAWASIASGFSDMVREIQDPFNTLMESTGQSFRLNADSISDYATNMAHEARRAGIQAGIQFDFARQFFEEALKFSSDAADVLSGEGDGEGGAGGSGGISGRMAEQMARRLEALRESLRTEEESEIESHARRLEEIQKFWDARMITDAEAHDMIERARQQHEDRMADIAERARRVEEQARSQMFGYITGTLSAISNVMDREGDRQIGIQKAISLAIAAINVAEGITKALTLPFPMNLLAAAQTAAQGIAAIASINSASRGSASTPTVAAPTAEAIAPAPQSIYIQGIGQNDFFTGGMVLNLIEEINKQVADGAVIKVMPT